MLSRHKTKNNFFSTQVVFSNLISVRFQSVKAPSICGKDQEINGTWNSSATCAAASRKSLVEGPNIKSMEPRNGTKIVWDPK